MKLIKIVFAIGLISLTYTSCNQKKKDSSSLSRIKINDTSNQRKRVISSIVDLPFGSKTLVQYKFPEKWVASDESNEESPVGEVEKEIYEVVKFYVKINKIKSIDGPEFKTVKFKPIGDDSLIINDNRMFKGDYKYQLPDFGKYKCYYQYMEHRYGDNRTNPIITKDNKEYMQIGSLVFYEPDDQSAKVINIFYSYSYEDSDYERFRYFYIDSDKTIEIFEGGFGETENVFDKTQEIHIDKTGDLIIKNLNKRSHE